MLTLKQILATGILESYTIASGEQHLDHDVRLISILETPDFEKYIQPNSLVLTTLYPIKSDLKQFSRLLQLLSSRDVAGILIKLKRYVDVIPTSILEEAKRLDFPIITMDYDANLSTLSSRILQEISTQNLRNISLSSVYLELIRTLETSPSIDALLSFKPQLGQLDFWIYAHAQNKEYVTHPDISDAARTIQQRAISFQQDKKLFLYRDEIILDQRLLYTLVIVANESQQALTVYYSEIIKMMLVFIHQRKQEHALQQNQFLLELLTNPVIQSDEELFKKATLFQWNIIFPLVMVLCDVDHQKSSHQDVETLRSQLMFHYEIEKEDIRFVTMNQRILFMFHMASPHAFENKLRQMVIDFERTHPDRKIRIAYTTNIHQVSQIAQSYATLHRGLNVLLEKRSRESIVNDQSIKMLGLLGKISEYELRDFVHTTLGTLLAYEKKHGGQLVDTLYTLINHQFNMKKAAEELFIHYNTLRHRLQTLETLGYGKDQLQNNHFDLIFAIYIAKNSLI